MGRYADRPLHRLAGGAQAVSQLRELLCHGGALVIGQCELREQLQRTLIGETRAIEVPPLLLPTAQSGGMQMPSHHGQLRLEMIESPEFFHA